MIHGFLRVCTLSPSLRVADCPYNAKMTVEAMRQAAADGAQLAVFPELGLTGYTCSDLFLQQPLQRAAEEALRTVLETSETLALVTAVGLPVNVDGKLYNCAAVLCNGELLADAPRNRREHVIRFDELSGAKIIGKAVEVRHIFEWAKKGTDNEEE